MRISFFSTFATLAVCSYALTAGAQTIATPLSANLSIGAKGPQVVLLQQILNKDTDTRIPGTGPGSLGNETDYFGAFTKAAVIRFQEKYANEVLTPAGLSQGNGFVGVLTRTKLNSLSKATSSVSTNQNATQAATTSTTNSTTPFAAYAVKENEKIDIYAGDAKLAAVQKKILDVINTAITSRTTSPIIIPTIATTETPSVVIQKLSSNASYPGDRITITGSGILMNSVVYFGSDYIVRSLDRDLSGNFSFIIPPLPAKRYDLAIATNGSVSSTQDFVISNPRNPSLQIQTLSPNKITYGDTITITGSGFTKENNTVVTSYQKFKGVPSSDGKTLSITVSPEKLQEAAKIGNKSNEVPMYIYIVNDYGFSGEENYFTMTL